jgi:hypothetical protein
MKSKIALLSTLVILVIAAAGNAQSLAELAKKEKERRAKAQANAKVITNKDTSKYKGGALTTSSGSTRGSRTVSKKSAGATTETVEESENTEPMDFFGRPESFWRQTFSDARQLVESLSNESKVLNLRIAELQNRFYSEDNGFKQQDIQRQIQKTIYEQDLNRDNLEKAKKALQELETEARKSGALPGWLRAKK